MSGVVLEALKERGDVVSKIAYGDWTRAGDYSRSLTQHATKLVQRNLTPGGDKNGADINLALDALEMAFTHGHINAYVIVGGDSDFITLVEKLKQYDKQIFVVGGRAFTSLVMQRNCHEFIAYENLVELAPLAGSRPPDRAGGGDADDLARAGRAARAARAEGADRSRGLPAARPAEEHAAAARLDVLRAHLRRRQLPRLRAEARRGRARHAARVGPQRAGGARRGRCRRARTTRRHGRCRSATRRSGEAPAHAPAARQPAAPSSAAPAAAPAEPRVAEGIREVRRLFQSAQNPPRWPMYIRQAKQFLRNVDATFDERKFGFASLVDLMRACQRDGLFRIERDRQGVMRIFPGNVMQAVSEPVTVEPDETEESDQRDFLGRGGAGTAGVAHGAVAAEPGIAAEPWRAGAGERRAKPEVVDGDVLQEMEAPQPVIDGEAEPIEAPHLDPPPQAPAGSPRAGRTQDGRRRRRSDGRGRHRAGHGSDPRSQSPKKEPADSRQLIGCQLPTAGRSAARARRSSRAADGCGAR